MSLDDIKIHRAYPVINGYVELPNNLAGLGTRIAVNTILTLWPGATVQQLTGAHGDSILQQKWVEFPESITCCGSNQQVEDLKTHYGTDTPTTPRGWPPGIVTATPTDSTPTSDYPGVACDSVDCTTIAATSLLVSWTPAISLECCKGERYNMATLRPYSDTECYWSMATSGLVISIELVNSNGYCYYWLTIYCGDTGDLVYSGYYTPSAGTTPAYAPAGTYTQVAGCDQIEVTVDIIQVG